MDTQTESDVSIQWKGTTVCCDFHCECGAYAHICGVGFMYQIKCADCGVIWAVPDRLVLHRTTNMIVDASTVDASQFQDETTHPE